jgi:hypothetical protein
VSEGARSILDVEEVKKFLGDKRVGRFTVDQAISTVRVLTPDGKKINPVLDN